LASGAIDQCVTLKVTTRAREIYKDDPRAPEQMTVRLIRVTHEILLMIAQVYEKPRYNRSYPRWSRCSRRKYRQRYAHAAPQGNGIASAVVASSIAFDSIIAQRC